MNRLVVWDLHGTLECGNEIAVIMLSNEVLTYRGYRQRFKESDAIRLYGMKWFEYFQFLLPDEEPYIWKALQDDCFLLSERELQIQTSCMTPTPGSHQVLEKIGSDHEQILISNTRPRNLEAFMNRLGLNQYFPAGHYFAVDGHTDQKATKIQMLEEYIAGRTFERIVVVGDSKTDMKLGDAFGAFRVLFNHPYLQRKPYGADLYTSDLRDLLNV